MRLSDRTKDWLRRHWRIGTGVALTLVLVAAGVIYLSTASGATTVDASRATTVKLPGGGSLIIPPGAMKDGAKVSAVARGDQPTGTHDGIRLLGQAVELVSDPPNAIHGVLTLELPVPVNETPDGVDPAVWFGVSTYDAEAKSWQPQTATYDASRHLVVALINHFSWWNPFSWDFKGAFDSVVQGFGEFVGKRADAPHCTGQRPDWVDDLGGVTDQSNVAVRACGQSDGDALDVELVNNRPYGQVVRFGSAVKRASHEAGSGATEIVLSALVDATMEDQELYLPPLAHASVAVSRLASKSSAIFHIGPSVLTIGADLALELLEPLNILSTIAGKIAKIPALFKSCRVPNGDERLTDREPGQLWKHAVAVFKCVWDGLRSGSTSLGLRKEQLDRLAALGEMFARATPVLNGIKLAGDYLWQVADLVADWFAHGSTPRGNGFEVRAKGDTPSTTATPPPTPPAKTPSGPSWWECFLMPILLPACLFK